MKGSEVLEVIFLHDNAHGSTRIFLDGKEIHKVLRYSAEHGVVTITFEADSVLHRVTDDMNTDIQSRTDSGRK